MTKLTYLLPLLIGSVLLTSCGEENFQSGLEAERQYVDLLYALQSGDTLASRQAARVLDGSVRELRQIPFYPLSGRSFENFHYHVNQAECAYGDARASIEEGELDVALVQLDRAVFELAAGDPAGLQRYYVASIYDFVAALLEVNYFLRESDGSYSDRELRSCGKDIYSTWRSVRGFRPSDYDYFLAGSVDEELFDRYHATLDREVGVFRELLREGENPRVREQINVVSEALWDLLLLFGTPTDQSSELAQ